MKLSHLFYTYQYFIKFRILQVMFKKHTQVSILYTNVYFSIEHSLLNTRNEF